jgi:phosphopantetheinyl transferase
MSGMHLPISELRANLGCVQNGARDSSLLASDWGLLDSFERHCADSIGADRRDRFISTRALVRKLLSDSCEGEIDPRAWKFSENAHGKRRLHQPPCGGEGIEFSVSHTDDLTIVAAARVISIGVDIEDTSVNLPWLEMARHFFAEEEFDYLSNCKEGSGLSCFYSYWTAKESVLKAIGCGLQGRLDGVRVNLRNPDLIGISLDGDSAEMSVKQIAYKNRFLISVCTQGVAPTQFTIRNYA